MPLPTQLIGKGSWVSLSHNFLGKMHVGIHPELAKQLREARGLVYWIKIPRHTRTAYAAIMWHTLDKRTGIKEPGIKEPSKEPRWRGWAISADQMLNMRHLVLVESPYPDGEVDEQGE